MQHNQSNVFTLMMIAVRLGRYYKQYLVTRLRSNLIYFMQFNELLKHSQRDIPYIPNVFNILVNYVKINCIKISSHSS